MNTHYCAIVSQRHYRHKVGSLEVMSTCFIYIIRYDKYTGNIFWKNTRLMSCVMRSIYLRYMSNLKVKRASSQARRSQVSFNVL